MSTSSVQASASGQIWQGEHYNRTYSALKNSFSDEKSCIVVTGSKGVGKTTIVNQFVEELGDGFQTLAINGEQNSELDFYSSIASGFGVGSSFSSKVQFLVEFGNFLYKCNDQGKQVVLVIDDCHRLPQPLLEIIRQIANIERDGKRLLHLFLIGDISFDKTISSRRNKPLRLSLALHHQVKPFELKDTAEYVNFRLESVGCKEKVFCLKGVEIVHKACRGRVRKINALCEHVLAKTESMGGIAVELSSIYESVEQLGFGEVEAKPIAIEKPEQKEEEKKILYQTPEEVLAEEEQEPVFEEAIQEFEREKRRKPALWLGLILLLGLSGAAGWWFLNKDLMSPPVIENVAAEEPAEEEPAEEESKIVVPIVPPSQPVTLAEDADSVPSVEEPVAVEMKVENKVAEAAVASVEKEIDRETEKTSTEEIEEVAEQAVTELPALPLFPENRAAGNEAEELQNTVEEIKTEQFEEKETEVAEKTEVAVEKEVPAIAVPQILEEEVLLEPVTVQEVVEPPPTKPEPTVLPLEPEVENSTVEEKLAAALDNETVEQPESEQPLVVVELDDVSKKRPQNHIASLEQEKEVEPAEEPKENKDYPKDVFIFRLEPDSSEMTDFYKEKFKEFVKLAKEHPELPIQVRGYVSSDNDTDENRELSRRRAIQVYKMLLDNGIEFIRVQVIGMGVKDPITSNATPQGRYKNRRVEVEFVVDDKS